MATTLHRVHENFVYRLGLIVPQYQAATLRARFLHLDGVDPRQSGGSSRGYEVRRTGRDGPEGTTSLFSRKAVHVYVVEVYYSTEFTPSDLDEIVSQDSHDIIKALRDPAGWLGYAGSSTGTTGIMSRLESGDEVVTERGVTTWRGRFAVRVREVERA